MDYNKTTLYGRLTADPKQLSGETPGAGFTVASSNSFTKNGEKVENTLFMNCVAWNKTAEIVLKYARKGTKVLVDGQLEQKTYVKDDGTKKVTYQLKIREFILAESKKAVDNEPDDFLVDDVKYNNEPEVSIDKVPF